MKPVLVAGACLLLSAGAILVATPAEGGSSVTIPPSRVFAHNSGGFVPVPAGFETMSLNLGHVGNHDGAEPSVGVDAEGRIFYQSMLATFRSADDGLSWLERPVTLIGTGYTWDPMVYVDPTTGRVFSNQLQQQCSYSQISDDGGNTWIPNPIFCGPAWNTGEDHQKILAAPMPPDFAPPVPLTYPNMVYYAWNEGGASRIAWSFDGGITFPQEAVTVSGTCSGGLHGRPRALSDGTLLIPKRDCGGPRILTSTNARSWWNTKIGTDVGSTTHRKNPDIAVDAADDAYVAFTATNDRVYLSYSADPKARVWGPSIKLSPPNVLSATMPAAVAGAPGRLAVMYYGTDDSALAPDHVPTTARWHAYLTLSFDANAANPTFVTYQLSDDADPIQVGPISTNTDGHAPSGSRNLLDFVDIVLTPDGRAVLAYADGCTTQASCTTLLTMATSRDALSIAAVQTAGPNLLT